MSDYPNSVDAFNVIGTANYMDESGYVLQEHLNTHGSAVVALENTLGTTAGTSVLKQIGSGEFAVSSNGGTTTNSYISGGTVTGATIQGSGISNSIITTPAITGGTYTSPTLAGTPVLDADSAIPFYGDNMSRQAIINGNFDVWQRGTSFTASANNDDVYTADRWNLISDGNDAADISQEAITDLPGSNYALKLDVETAKRSGIVQFLEAKDAQKFQGKTISVSFAVKSANIAAIRAAVLSWDSTADSVTSDVVGTWAATPTWATNWTQENTPADLTVTSSWTTVTITGISIDTASMANLALAIWLPNEETIGDIIYISQVQMCMGSVALPFQPKSYAQELADCQRYCVEYSTSGTFLSLGHGVAASTTSNQVLIVFPQQMRTLPTMTATAGDWFLWDGVSVIDITAIATRTNHISNKNVVLNTTVAAGLTQYRVYMLMADGNANRQLIFEAEL